MNTQSENAPSEKCALLSLLPLPKNGGQSQVPPPTKKLPVFVRELQPKQTTGKQFWKKDVFDDDEEFDAKLAEKSRRIRDQGRDDDSDDSPGPEEGPARPTKAPSPIGQTVAQITLNRPLGIDYGDSDSSDNEAKDSEADSNNSNDSRAQQNFFGLLSTSPVEKRAKMEQQQFDEPQLFIDEVAPGPTKPAHATTGEIRQESGSNLHVREISDEEAHRLIYEKELAPFGANPMIAQDAVSQLVDVSVDNALGPNVRENLLKNLSGKQMAQLPLGPLPKMKKSDSDKLAKRKHQITHLAAVAVSREEQLQEKWADSKQNKKMSRQKYGF